MKQYFDFGSFFSKRHVGILGLLVLGFLFGGGSILFAAYGRLRARVPQLPAAK